MSANSADICRFNVVYDGESHKKHHINIAVLGKSLVALDELLRESNIIMYGNQAPIDVEVSSDFIKGSAGVEVLVSHVSVEMLQVIGFAASVSVTTLFSVLRQIRGKKLGEIVDNGDGTVTMEYGQKKSIICTKDVSKLVTNKKIRNAIEEIIKAPLENNGTDTVRFEVAQDDGYLPPIEFHKSDARYFGKLVSQSDTLSDTWEQKVKFIAADTAKKSGWKIEVKGEYVDARMEDENFLFRLKGEEKSNIFGKAYIVMLKRIDYMKMGKVRSSKWIIVKVKHKSVAEND